MYTGNYEGYQENFDEAEKWLKKAYQSGESRAASALASLYSSSIGFFSGASLENLEQAEKWLTLAAANDELWVLRELSDVRGELKKRSAANKEIETR